MVKFLVDESTDIDLPTKLKIFNVQVWCQYEGSLLCLSVFHWSNERGNGIKPVNIKVSIPTKSLPNDRRICAPGLCVYASRQTWHYLASMAHKNEKRMETF